jgi:L-ribulose-5-phosphate 4-epimerase
MTSFSPEIQVAIARTRDDVARLHEELVRYELVVWTGGNVSGRVPGADLFVIKPSGVAYDDLSPENQILCDLDGNVIPSTPGSDRSPSSDTAAHAYIYRNMPEVGGVVHTHSTYATAWAARGVVETLSGHRSRAVLMQNHGVFTIGKNAKDAVKAAVMAEDVAKTVHISRQLGAPLPIAQSAIDSLFDRYQNVYGQEPTGALK